MEHQMANLLKRYEGGIERRQLLRLLGLSATAGLTAAAVASPEPAAAAAAGSNFSQIGVRTFPATTVNHLRYESPNYEKVRDFYVDLFGMRVTWDSGQNVVLEFGDPDRPNGIFLRNAAKDVKPSVEHIAFGVANLHSAGWVDNLKAEFERRKLANIRPDTSEGWSCDDPNGYPVNVVVEKSEAMFPGAAPLCNDVNSAKCKDGFAAGKKNLASAPKPSGRGFKAYAFSHIVLNCADIDKGKEFYENVLGMTTIWDRPEDKAKKWTRQVFLRFGENTLYLRPAGADGKPYCTHFALAIHDYNQDKVEAELKRRGLNPTPDSKMGWTIRDPDGLRVEVAGWGLPEYIRDNCPGGNTTCPGGQRG